MITVEQNQENTDGGREQEQPVLREHIGVQQAATVMHADKFLFLLVDTVEGSKVDVRGRLVDVNVIVTGSEDAGKRKGVSRGIGLTG